MYNYDSQELALQNDIRNMRRENDRRNRPQRVVLNTSTGGLGPLPVITTTFSEPLAVVDVSINTCGMRRPTILLNFSSIISLPLGISVTLNFQLLRSTDDSPAVKVGSTYTFATLVDILEARSFGFQYGDNDVVPGKYTYSVILTTNSLIDITPGLTIPNATLSALAVDNR
ncbi:MAG: hypothetical protein K0S30_1758 [Clostridia bacterium]|jgi:hypothetical protein|nr:hypothetical protein [Clostridia bacterium]MDF2878662.1 hypothetical protein [Clostridia bacterium]